MVCKIQKKPKIVNGAERREGWRRAQRAAPPKIFPGVERVAGVMPVSQDQVGRRAGRAFSARPRPARERSDGGTPATPTHPHKGRPAAGSLVARCVPRCSFTGQGNPGESPYLPSSTCCPLPAQHSKLDPDPDANARTIRFERRRVEQSLERIPPKTGCIDCSAPTRMGSAPPGTAAARHHHHQWPVPFRHRLRTSPQD